MSKLKILFLAADPLSTQPDGPDRLRLDEDVRQILEGIREAEHRNRLDFIPRMAVRPKDLLRALNQTRPQVVHFSGHGSPDGLFIWDSDGDGPHIVPPEALVRLFRGFRDCVQVVVLNACYSLPQAKAIADVVGCAIGTPGEIPDSAAITFGAAFYSAIAYGKSVREAHEQACSLLAVEGYDPEVFPQLITRPGVDSAQLILIGPDGQAIRKRRLAALRAPIAGLILACGVTLIAHPLGRPPPPACRAAGAVQAAAAASYQAVAPASPNGVPAAPGSQLACAVALDRVGDHDAAFRIFQQDAKLGDPRAMGYLGIAYMHGSGTPRDPERGMHWLRAAAAKRDLHGMNALAWAYQTGQGGARRLHWARYWYMIAAAMGDTEAMRSLGNLDRDMRKYDSAFAWYRKAMEAGSQDARVDIGEMYEEGLGKQRNLSVAWHLYHLAAESGCARAMFALGRMHHQGSGGTRDYARARDWYRKAAEAGSADAMNNLGVLYQNGWGVPQNLGTAIEWYRKARDAGSAAAPASLHAVGAS